MRELQKRIELLSVESFSDPSIAYRRFPDGKASST
jgi:hypothetical protein